MSDLDTLIKTEGEPRLAGDHIIDWRDPRNDAASESEKPIDVYRMLCGEEVPVTLDGELLRDGFDFYDCKSGHKAQCPVCLAIWKAMASQAPSAAPENK